MRRKDPKTRRQTNINDNYARPRPARIVVVERSRWLTPARRRCWSTASRASWAAPRTSYGSSGGGELRYVYNGRGQVIELSSSGVRASVSPERVVRFSAP